MNAVRLESEMKLQAKIIAKKLTSEDSCKEIDTGPHTPTLEQESADIYCLYEQLTFWDICL